MKIFVEFDGDVEIAGGFPSLFAKFEMGDFEFGSLLIVIRVAVYSASDGDGLAVKLADVIFAMEFGGGAEENQYHTSDESDDDKS